MTQIGGWTESQLATYIQNRLLIDPPTIPKSLNLEGGALSSPTLTGLVNFDGAMITVGGVLIPQQSFIGVGQDNSVHAMYADQSGTAAWQAGGGDIVAEAFDITMATDGLTLTSGRVFYSLLYVPSKCTVQNMHIVCDAGPPTTSTFSGLALYKPNTNLLR